MNCQAFLMYEVNLELFGHCQKQNTDNNNSNENIGFPGKLFLQENPGKQQRNHADRGQNGSGNRIHTTQSINIGKLAGGFEQCGENLPCAGEPNQT